MVRQKCEHCGKTMRFRKKTKDWTHKSPRDWMGCSGPDGMVSFIRMCGGPALVAEGIRALKGKHA